MFEGEGLLAFLDIKLSIEDNGLCTSVHYKPTDSHSYLKYEIIHIWPAVVDESEEWSTQLIFQYKQWEN